MNTDPRRPRITAQQIVDRDQKMNVLRRHFGSDTRWVEDAIDYYMETLVRAHSDEAWLCYELSNGGFYMAPEFSVDRVHVYVEDNGYCDYMSPDAAGITVCLYAIGELANSHVSPRLLRHFYQLRNFALEHAEAKEILAAGALR